MTPFEFAAVIERSIVELHPRLEIALDKIGELAETLAASYPGTGQPGWPALAESTLADKAAHGWPTPSPLKRDGEMAESIKKELDPINLEVAIGSNDKKALWQEMGTTRGIPPRPFLALGMRNSIPFAMETLGKIAATILGK
jgi:hypothetical protein